MAGQGNASHHEALAGKESQGGLEAGGARTSLIIEIDIADNNFNRNQAFSYRIGHR